MPEKSAKRKSAATFNISNLRKPPSVEAPQPAPDPQPAPGPQSAEGEGSTEISEMHKKARRLALPPEIAALAIQQGFTPRGSWPGGSGYQKIDGRTLRATGRVEAFSARLTPGLKAKMNLEAKRRKTNVGALMDEFWCLYCSHHNLDETTGEA